MDIDGELAQLDTDGYRPLRGQPPTGTGNRRDGGEDGEDLDRWTGFPE